MTAHPVPVENMPDVKPKQDRRRDKYSVLGKFGNMTQYLKTRRTGKTEMV
jgi:hypothetical protein